ncbi:MAG: LytTR family DNA-binding domain-containing protein [Alistipes sp.]|nr:response regulator transcription factor [Alistipes sp.]MDO5497588.1 LytTR family DNA-binding domain-containing protein [Alistipes sp.]
MMRCIAIDDEPLALRQLKSYIAKIGELELLDTFKSAVEAQIFLERSEVDLIFVDINMPDLNGIEFVRGLKNPPLVVFTTAYSEYAIEGFRLDAVDYLLKPFSFDEFARSVKKAASLIELAQLRNTISEEIIDGQISAEENQAEENADYISIKADYKVSLVRHADIVYMESVGEYVRLHLTDDSTLTTLFRLKNMESALPDEKFMRIHRSYIINLSHIAGYTKGKVYMDNREDLPIGANYKEAFKEYTERLGE